MKNFNKSRLLITVFIGTIFLQVSCKKDYTDPNKATEDQVFSSARGLTGAVVGLQRVYTLGRASTLYNLITINGLTTNELIVVNTGNTAEVQLAAGGTSVDGNHSMLTTYWTTCNKTIFDADRVITNSTSLVDKSYASGLIAYASIFKAMSIADMAQFWEKIPAGIGTIATPTTFIDRIDGFKAAIKVLDDAQAAINTNAISATFIANIPVGMDIQNTLYALKARYSLYAGLNAQALTAANLVNLNVKSVFSFDAVSLNPVFEVATSTNNVVQVKDSTLGLPPVLAPSLTDQRVPFYTVINPTVSPRFRIKGFFNTATTAIPVYLPGEMTLIKAEVYARTNDSTTSKTFVNMILTKTPASDPFGVGANEAARNSYGSYAALLDEIYRQRCIEMFMSGQKLEDMRRFARPLTERKRNLMPYPLRERDNNPNTPADPPF
ncbi:MAG: RagB/SusD family nutrient uptake outer membrane protein [Ferruginibacter sp.]